MRPPPAPDVPPPRPARHAAPEQRHGGAWKVAYADFVTALMALFIVLWMMNCSKEVKDAVAGYFHDPRGYTQQLGAGPGGASGPGVVMDHSSVGDIRRQLELALHRMPEFGSLGGNVRFSITGEGLRVDLLETEQGLFFITGSPRPTPAGEHLLRLLASEISRLPNAVAIEGHTDARPFRAGDGAYGNWELSTDRANSARRLLQTYGVPAAQVVEVRGFAAGSLLDPAHPEDPKNRRVSVVVKFDPQNAAK